MKSVFGFLTLESFSRRWPLVSLESNFRYSCTMFTVSSAVSLVLPLQHVRVRNFPHFDSVSRYQRALLVWNCSCDVLPKCRMFYIPQGHLHRLALHQLTLLILVARWRQCAGLGVCVCVCVCVCVRACVGKFSSFSCGTPAATD